MDQLRIRQLKETAKEIRLSILKEVYSASSGHPGGSLSAADILTYLYFDKMNIDPQNPAWPDRDRFVLSKGHAAPALYAALAQRGYFSKDTLSTLRQIDSILQGHPDMKKIPGVDMSTGSLGIGLSNACGMALAARLQKKNFRVYSLTGDGEIQEGQIWEAAMFASHYHLDNLFACVDANGLQIDGKTEEVMGTEPTDKRFEAFGWDVQRISGHDFEAIDKAFANAEKVSGKPHMIILDTIKGKGVSFMENRAEWHGKAPKKEEYEQAVKELSEAE